MLLEVTSSEDDDVVETLASYRLSLWKGFPLVARRGQVTCEHVGRCGEEGAGRWLSWTEALFCYCVRVEIGSRLNS